ncbi:hypothetical protein GW17_00025342, partial [Ensete ventricosum]
MALVDLIGVKLEALETYMEDRLCALFIRTITEPDEITARQESRSKGKPLEKEERAMEPVSTHMWSPKLEDKDDLKSA